MTITTIFGPYNILRSLDKLFREEVFDKKGYKKGNLQESVIQAIKIWIWISQREPDKIKTVCKKFDEEYHLEKSKKKG